MSPGSTWEYGSFILGCGTFGGIGGSPHLVGRGLDEASALATMDEAIALGITLFDTAGSYAAGASESMIERWLMERGPSRSDGIRISTKVGPPRGNDSDQRFDAAFADGAASRRERRIAHPSGARDRSASLMPSYGEALRVVLWRYRGCSNTPV